MADKTFATPIGDDTSGFIADLSEDCSAVHIIPVTFPLLPGILIRCVCLEYGIIIQSHA